MLRQGMNSIIVNDQRRCLRKHSSDRERIDLDLDLVLRIIDAQQSQVFADKLPRKKAAHRNIADCSDDDVYSWFNSM